MKRHSLALVLIGLLALISEKAQSAKYGHSTSSVYQDGDQETTSSVPSVVVSSSSTNKRKGGSYASHNYGNSNYYDYTPSLEFAPVQSPYYSKYYSDPLPAYTRQQRYVHPEYLNDGVVSAQSNSLAYSLPQSFAIADSSGEPYASASHSGGHSHSHGHMHGHGHKQPHYQISAVNTDAIGLLGLLGLLGILQAVLLLLTTTTAATTGKRKKRDLDAEELEEYEKRHMTVEKLTKLVLPSLNVVAQARIGKISVNCTQREVCKTNKFLVENMGPDGKVASYRLTDAMEKMICAFDQSEHLKASIKRAGHLGRSSADCEKLYPICKDLRFSGVYSVPVLLPPSHPLYYDNVKAGKLGK